MSIATRAKMLKLSENNTRPGQNYVIASAYFLFTLRLFILYLSGSNLSRFIALPDLNRFRLMKPLVLFIDYFLRHKYIILLLVSQI